MKIFLIKFVDGKMVIRQDGPNKTYVRSNVEHKFPGYQFSIHGPVDPSDVPRVLALLTK